MNSETQLAIEADFLRELAELEAESIGWQLLEPGAYLHVEDDQATEVLVVGIPQAGMNVVFADGVMCPEIQFAQVSDESTDRLKRVWVTANIMYPPEHQLPMSI